MDVTNGVDGVNGQYAPASYNALQDFYTNQHCSYSNTSELAIYFITII